MLFVALIIMVGVAVFFAGRWYIRRSKLRVKLSESEEGRGPQLLRSFRPIARQFGDFTRQLPLLRIKERYARLIERAGLRFELSADEFIAIKVAVLLLMIGVALLVQFFLVQNWLIAICLILVGFIYPDLALSSAGKKQEHACLRALPGFLDLLALSVEAGMGFDSAVLRLTDVLEPSPLIQRFRAYLRSVSVGRTRNEALREMARKLDLKDFTAFSNTVIQAAETGASMGPVLRTASSEMLSRRFERAEKAAFELPVKILLPLFVFVFPATFLMILGPLYFQFTASGAAGVL